MISSWGGKPVFPADLAIIFRIMLYAVSAMVTSLNTMASLLLLIILMPIKVLVSLIVISISHLVMYFAMISALLIRLSSNVVYCTHSVFPSEGDRKLVLRMGSFLGNSQSCRHHLGRPPPA